MANNAEWVNFKKRQPEYDNHYCCIAKGLYKVCFYNPYHNKWFEFGHETEVDYWLDDFDWHEQNKNSIYNEA